jgi:hypothetical protein
MSTDEKRCTGPCGQMKPLVAFHKKKSGSRGRKAWCRDCVSQHEKERREKIRVPPKNLAINMVEKRCSGPCGQVKRLEDFYEDKRHTNGRRSYCKDCVCERQKVYRGNNREEREAYNKAYHKNNKEAVIATQKVWRENNKEEIAANRRVYQRKHKEKLTAYQKVYREQHRERLALAAVERAKRRRKIDPIYKIRLNLRNRLQKLLKGKPRHVSSMNLAGCTREELMLHLQKQFKLGMSWNNYGPVWHVDHLKPCVKFDLTDPEQQKACFHYTNLQPLFGPENIKKGARYEVEEEK